MINLTEKRTYRLSEDVRVRRLVEKAAAPEDNVSTDEDKDVCVHCGAQLVSDEAFQELHMQKEHGLVI